MAGKRTRENHGSVPESGVAQAKLGNKVRARAISEQHGVESAGFGVWLLTRRGRVPRDFELLL